MPSRADIYREAQRWVGTPYHHHGRVRGQACDCIGLVIGVARNIGLKCPPDRKLPDYSQLPHDHIAENTASRLLAATAGPERPGQIGLFWFRDEGHGQHFAIFGDYKGRLTMIHAYMHSRKVVEAGMSDFWSRRLIRIYDYKGIADA